jgi:beta-lactamase superfamily II metal-dependent hydrolase
MPVVKSFAVCSQKGQCGDMFYINHGSDNFTVIDCCLNEDRSREIIKEIKDLRSSKGIFRFISTHPDDDHICGIKDLNDNVNIDNFYCVANKAKNPDGETDFEKYCALRDGKSAYHICQGCKRKWMNLDSDTEDTGNRGNSGINIHWPIINNSQHQDVLDKVKDWDKTNNLSPIIRYSVNGGASFIWFGDMENDFMETIKDDVKLEKTQVVFAPHHGRESGTLIKEWLDKLKPKLIIIGEAPAENICYYPNHDTITQNSAGDITFNCNDNEIDIYVSEKSYADTKRFNGYIHNVLPRRGYKSGFGYYVGTIVCD